MIGKLAFNNLKKTYKIYLIYVFTLTLTISLFYGFGALEQTQAVLKLDQEDATYARIFLTLMDITSYFVSFFVVFLMVYASEFFFKVRSKEYYIYKTLGMSKNELVKLIFSENLLIGAFSLIFGIILGVFVNQLLSKTLIDFIGIDAALGFAISFDAMIKTALYFTVILLLVSIFSAIKINRKSIIELKNFKSIVNKKKQNKFISSILIVVGILTLTISYIAGYYSELNPGNPLFIISIISGFIGTTFAYFGLINWKNSNFKNKEHNEKTFKNAMLYNRLMKNKMSISMISVSFVFILTAIFGANSLISIFDLESILPNDAIIKSFVPEEYDLTEIDVTEYGLDKNQSVVYRTGYFSSENSSFPIIKQSEFNDLLKMSTSENSTSTEKYQFFKGEDFPIFDEKGNNTGDKQNSVDSITEILLPENEKIVVSENTEVTKKFEYGVLVVSDELIDELEKANPGTINYELSWQEMVIDYKSDADEEKVLKIAEILDEDYTVLTTIQQIKKTTMVFKISILFITMYIAFFLVIISLAILAIQQVMDAVDNKDEYQKAQILGLNNREIKKIIRNNTNQYFIYPLYFAVISSIFALICVDNFTFIISGNHILDQQHNQNIFTIIIVLVIIYIVYMELVKSIYLKIIGEK